MRNLLAALLLAAGCHKNEDSGAGPEGPRSDCDPIDPSVCLLPFPSSHFLTEADTPTGFRVDFGPTSLPPNRDGVAWDPRYWNEKDGFSVSASLLTWFDGVSLEGVIPVGDPAAYADPDALTAIVDAQTGERIPHWVELDASIDNEVERVLILRPTRILDYGRRYVVGIRGLKTRSGPEVAVSPAFRSLRDGKRSDAIPASRQEHFDAEVFPLLADQGFDRSELQLAWDFTTVSRDTSLGRMEWMREDLYDRIGPGGPAYTLDEIVDGDCTSGHIARTITGTMTVPLYTEEDGPGTVLTRDADAWPFANGDTHPDFTLQIPCSLAADPRPAPVLQYGHGFFGTKGEARDGWLQELADTEGWLILATDWTGMSDEDLGGVTLMFAADPSRFAEVPERTMQGFVEALAATRMVQGDLVSDPAVAFEDADGVPVSVIDRETRYFMGNSMGGILGGALVGMSPDFERAVLGVTGTPFSMLTARSSNFIPFFLLLNQKYTDGRVISLLPPVAQMLWDPGESAGWVYELNRDVPAGMPTKQVLIQTAIGDAQVTTLGGQLQARAYGASLVDPPARPVFGLDVKTAPFSGSALVEWRYTDVGDEPVVSIPAPIDQNPHGCPRQEPLGMAQAAIFLNTGRIEQTCAGVCESTLAQCQ